MHAQYEGRALEYVRYMIQSVVLNPPWGLVEIKIFLNNGYIKK